MRISAVIFDLNGTVLEDEDEYGKAFNTVLRSLGVNSRTEYPQERGIGIKENWDIFIKKYSINTKKNSFMLADETQKEYLKLISEVNVRPGFDEFLDKLKKSGIKIGLATSNTWEQTDRILSATNLQGVFDAVTTCEEVVYNKPDPDIFTLSADKLGVDRDKCLIIEDSVAGVIAAKRAGMKVIALFGSEKDKASLSKADLMVEGFSEITPAAIDQL